MAEQMQLQPQEKKGFFASMSLFQKALLFIGAIIVLMLVVAIFLGGIKSFYEFFFYLTIFVIILVGAYIVIKATGMIFQPKYFSPREDFFTKLKNMASDYCPDNLGNLYAVGDVGKRRVLIGKIIGCLHLPYYSGRIKKYENDVVELVDDKKVITHKKGEIVYTEYKTMEGKKVPMYEDIVESTDGDTFFVTSKGLIFKKVHYIRMHRTFHSSLNGDVDMYDINPVPYGAYEYPYKQMQRSITQVMIQNQIEVIIATHEHQHDLISQSTDAGLYSNPLMRYNIKNQAEMSEGGQ